MRIVPDLAKWDTKSLDAKVLGKTPTKKPAKIADYCQINKTVLTAKSSFLKDKKGITTAFIFQTEDGELFTAHEQVRFPTAKDTNVGKVFDTYYQSLHGKKMNVIIDRGNKNSIISEYNAIHKTLPFCTAPTKTENTSTSLEEIGSSQQYVFVPIV